MQEPSRQTYLERAVADGRAAAFQEAAEAAKYGCPVSKALQGKVALSVEATLR